MAQVRAEQECDSGEQEVQVDNNRRLPRDWRGAGALVTSGCFQIDVAARCAKCQPHHVQQSHSTAVAYTVA